MAFTVEDVEDLLRVLRANPEWREAVRREVLGEELLRLPELVAQNSRDIQDLARSLQDVRSAVEAMATTILSLDRTVRVMNGRLADVAGGLYEERWVRGAYGRFGGRIFDARIVYERNLPQLMEARRNRTITSDEARSVRELDILLEGQEAFDGGERPALLAIEISTVIEVQDVVRAGERAQILRRVGYNAYPIVAGGAIRTDAQILADANAVEVFTRSEDIPKWAQDDPAALSVVLPWQQKSN